MTDDLAQEEAKLRRHTRKRLFPSGKPLQPVLYGQPEIEQLVPHRPPFLFIDRIDGVDLERGLISGRRVARRDDPVFCGHFPGNPVYPGTLLLEMLGQLGIALLSLSKSGGLLPGEGHAASVAFVVKIEGAYFVSPVRPGDEIVLLAQSSGWDGLLAGMTGQALVEERICCVVSGQVCE